MKGELDMINTPSPLRYPGGKTILYDKVRQIVEYNKLSSYTYIEPFAGGSGLALKLLFNNNVSSIIINDGDYAIYCIWHSILNNTKKLIQKIKNVEVSLSEWRFQKEIYINKENHNEFEVGFATLFLNRTNRSGIVKGGPIGGISQEGKYKIDCRFNKETLINKIQKIYEWKDKIKLYNLDVRKFIDAVIIERKDNSFTYFDPPYIQKGPELYKNFFQHEDHAELARKITYNLEDYKWIITYDDNKLVNELYENQQIEPFKLSYSAGTVKKGNEVMIYSKTIQVKEEQKCVNY
jgi:DNA adenine methylase